MYDRIIFFIYKNYLNAPEFDVFFVFILIKFKLISLLKVVEMMKESKYNFIYKHGKSWLIFNSLTGSLALISQRAKALLKICNETQCQTEVIKSLEYGGYVIKDNVDERKLLEFHRVKNKFKNDIANITIAVTLSCNFNCVYCFEKHSPIFISENVRHAIYERVELLAKNGVNIKITWYGGEPLLAKKSIWEMSEVLIKICEKYHVKYYADIVTNAYLLDKQIVMNFKKYKIKQVQTTLDGPEVVHNEMRKILGNNDGSFRQIIENLKLAREHDINVHLRIHINKVNEDKLVDLLSSLKANNLTSCSIDLGQIKPYSERCRDITGDCLDTKDFAKLSLHYQTLFEKYGFNTFCFDYPRPILSYCRKSHNVNSLIIGPSGELYSCWVEVGDESAVIGNIFENDCKKIANNHDLDYFLWSPFDYQMCIDCKILPICMGGCTHCAKQSGKPDCQIWRYILREVLVHKYENQKCNVDESKDVNYIVHPHPAINLGV